MPLTSNNISKIKNKNGDYQVYRCITHNQLPVGIKSEFPLIFFTKLQLKPLKTLQKDNFYYQETAQMTSTGSWYVDFKNKESLWDFETHRILEYPEDYRPSLKKFSELLCRRTSAIGSRLLFPMRYDGHSI